MSSTRSESEINRRAGVTAPQRPSVVLPVALLGLLIVGVAVAYKIFQNAPPPASAPTTTAPAQNSPPLRAIVPAEQAAPAPVAAPPVKAPAAPVRAASTPPVDARQLMAMLTSLNTNGPLSADDVQKWKESLQQLVRQGASSVPTIKDYLAQNMDVSFAGVPGADQLGYASLRAGLLNALGQIGGPEATSALLQTLQSTPFPADVAQIAATLQQQSPGQYDGDIMTAVRAQLTQASADQLGNANVGPLFQLLGAAAANGTDVSADLTQYASKWPYYASIELANLPNGTGLPALLQMAQDTPGSGQIAALQALAQLAPGNSQVAAALVNLAQQGQLSDAALSQLAPYLAGRENQLGSVDNPSGTTSQGLHIANGNQDFSAADLLNSLSPSQVNARISIIDQLLQALPAGDATGQQVLQQQKINLQGRLGK